MCSQFNTSKLWSVARYNSNNAWLYNGNNGKLNNNNLYNDLSSRALDYDILNYKDDQDFLNFLYEFYDAYYKCRKTKRSKHTQLEFEYNLVRLLLPLAISVYEGEYVPSPPIVFVIECPRLREVVAAWFGDRVVQTWYSEKLKPFTETEWLDEDSYSCRVGRGGLKAVERLQEYIFELSEGYTRDVILAKRDYRAFFMTIDPKWLEEHVTDFIWQNFGDNPWLRDKLCYLTRIIYCSLPQNHCIIKGTPLALERIEPRKSIRGKVIGLPIGNKTSQDAANFNTSPYLWFIRLLEYLFVHYTDDTAFVILEEDLWKWKRDQKYIDRYITDDLHLEWHPYKRYQQHYSKGIEFLGIKLRFDRRLPSSRIAHSFLWKCECAARKANESVSWTYYNANKFMQVFNSYTGLLKWSNSNRLRERGMEMIKNSRFSEMFVFHENLKVTIIPTKTKIEYFKSINKLRKIQINNERK